MRVWVNKRSVLPGIFSWTTRQKAKIPGKMASFSTSAVFFFAWIRNGLLFLFLLFTSTLFTVGNEMRDQSSIHVYISAGSKQQAPFLRAFKVTYKHEAMKKAPIQACFWAVRLGIQWWMLFLCRRQLSPPVVPRDGDLCLFRHNPPSKWLLPSRTTSWAGQEIARELRWPYAGHYFEFWVKFWHRICNAFAYIRIAIHIRFFVFASTLTLWNFWGVIQSAKVETRKNNVDCNMGVGQCVTNPVSKFRPKSREMSRAWPFSRAVLRTVRNLCVRISAYPCGAWD